MNYKIIFLSILIVISILSCNAYNHSNNKTSAIKDSIIEYKQIAFQKYGRDTLFLKSPANTYVLCKKNITVNNTNPNELSMFFVFDLSKNQIIYEDKISGAKISWKSDYELLIRKQKGIITSNIDKGQIEYLYNLKTKTIQNLDTKTKNSNNN
ncbi:MAG: hypothetical protein JXR51_07965 [Bacteroidales bacterium]|nr:hypothetical protein [Bacteroidales bacterium]